MSISTTNGSGGSYKPTSNGWKNAAPRNANACSQRYVNTTIWPHVLISSRAFQALANAPLCVASSACQSSDGSAARKSRHWQVLQPSSGKAVSMKVKPISAAAVPRVRRALYIAALPGAFHWNPELKALYDRLIARGKCHKAALTACARKLLIFANTVAARPTPWLAIRS